jgi:ADP-ribosylglycohydrolase
MGLPWEGMSRRRQLKRAPELTGPRFFLGRGMCSDDTEHTVLAAQALIGSEGDAARFARSMSVKLRFWLAGLPAGIGWATLRAILKLWCFVPPDRSGVNSAGNGPAMRSAILGVRWGHDPAKLRELVRANTRITHTDPRAEEGALAVATAAWHASTGRETEFVVPPAFADPPTENVKGFVVETVAFALAAWKRHPRDYRAAVLEAVRAGGDTDTVAAIVGGIVGAAVGKEGIPSEWLGRMAEWPRTMAWMESLGARLASGDRRPVAVFVPFLLLRNGWFLLVTLAHGVARLFPPY